MLPIMSDPDPTEIPAKNIDLLIVDDNEQFRLTLARAFENREFIVASAGCAEEALVVTDSQSPRHALVDLNLDGRTSGLELIPQLLERVPAMRVVVLTGYASIATAVRAVQLGATHYLAKPVEVDDILAAFQRTQGDPTTPLTASPMSVQQLEWEHLQRTLLECNGNISAAARALNLHRRSLQRKLGKHARW